MGGLRDARAVAVEGGRGGLIPLGEVTKGRGVGGLSPWGGGAESFEGRNEG